MKIHTAQVALVHLCEFIPMSQCSLIQWTFGIVPLARISPLACSRALRWMSRKGSFPHGQVQSTHGEKRVEHTTSPQQHRRGTRPLRVLSFAKTGDYKEHLPVFPVLLNSCHFRYQDHWIPANLTSCSQLPDFTFLCPTVSYGPEPFFSVTEI